MSIVAIYKEPFGIDPHIEYLRSGLTLSQIVSGMSSLPKDFADTGGVIRINNDTVPRHMWGMVKPHVGAGGVPVQITMHAPIRGGGDGKNIFSVIAGIALTAVTGFIGAGGAAKLLGSTFAAGTFGASALAAGVGLVGSLAIAALTPPPSLAATPEREDTGHASASGNVLQPNVSVPRVVGTRKIYPPLASEPFVYFDGPDEMVEAIFCLAGPHEVTDIRIDGSPLSDLADVDIETREGWSTDSPITLIDRYTRTTTSQTEVRGHVIDPDSNDQISLVNGSVLPSLPKPITMTTREATDEAQVQIEFPVGLHKNGDETDPLRVPFRVRIRSKSWIRENTYAPDVQYPATQDYSVPLASTTKNALIVVDLSFPTTPTGTIFEFGSATGTVGCYCGITSGEIVWRWGGAGNVATETNFVRIATSISALAGRTGTLVCEANIDDQTATIWFRETGSEILEIVATGSTDAATTSWTSTAAGAVGRISGGVCVGEDGTDFNGTITDARINFDTVLPAEWLQLPELHYQAASINPRRATIRLIWQSGAAIDPTASEVGEGWVEARGVSYGQTNAPAQEDWRASPYFQTITGFPYLDKTNDANATTGDETRLRNMSMDRYEAQFYLNPLYFPKGRYEVEVTRGAQFRVQFYDKLTYEISSTVWDLFGYQGDPAKVPAGNGGVADQVYVSRFASIKNAAPVVGTDFALVALRARNRKLGNVSTVASGYVQDWDGAAWTTWTKTSNPAPHLRDIYRGALSARPIPDALIDESAILTWRDAGHVCNAIIDNSSMYEAASIVASCGYGRPYMSDVWGVVRDYDRSAESPTQIFTPRNSANFSWKRAFPDLPDGFLVTFPDIGNDYDARQIVVPPSAVGGVLEQVTYEGLVTETAATQRATYDLAQSEERATFYTLDAPMEAIVCRRGDLVGVQHDMIAKQNGAGRVVGAEFDAAGDVTSITLDETPPDDATGAAIRRADGTITVHEYVLNGDKLVFTAPIDRTGIEYDVLVSFGLIGNEYLRLIVFAVEPKDDLTATLTLVDEAPLLFQ